MEIKYASRPFGLLTNDELLISANALLLKIHAICGWAIPEPSFAQILKEQFVLKLREGYANVNMQEVEYACRTYGSEVKDWGKSMNLSLIDEVMLFYLRDRNNISRFEEGVRKPLPESKEDLSEVSMQDWYDDIKKKVKDGMDYPLLPVMLYDWLDKKGEIRMDNKTKYGYMDLAARKLESQGELPEMEKVKNLAKRMALNDHILKNG